MPLALRARAPAFPATSVRAAGVQRPRARGLHDAKRPQGGDSRRPLDDATTPSSTRSGGLESGSRGRGLDTQCYPANMTALLRRRPSSMKPSSFRLSATIGPPTRHTRIGRLTRGHGSRFSSGPPHRTPLALPGPLLAATGGDGAQFARCLPAICTSLSVSPRTKTLVNLRPGRIR
jgi:hypothetical protein